MTRKQERKRRVIRWAAPVAAAIVAASGLGIWLGAPGWLAGAVLVAGALLLGHRAMIAPPGVAILTYHSVSPDPAWLPWSREIAVHPATLDRHLATLARMGATVMPTRALVDLLERGGPLPPCPVALHFDDGYLDNLRHAAPLLRQYGYPATFFASLDFIEPGEGVRGGGPDDGYMRWDELAELARQPGFEVEPHGVGHARLATSDRVVGTLTAENWRHHAWMQWAATPGPKHDWYRRDTPEAVPLGSAIPQSGLALAERGIGEDVATLEARIMRDLTACRDTFRERLGIVPAIFCWPENQVGEEGRRIAETLGYRATTGGRGRNAANEPPAVLSRIHMGDRAIGVRWLTIEALHLHASVRLMQGNHYWYLLLIPMHVARRLVTRFRDRIGDNFA